jgi:Ca2+-binding EF-hand superfamily protein
MVEQTDEEKAIAQIRAILADESKLHDVSKQVFDSVDTDNSGKIEKKELKTALLAISSQSGLPPPSDDKIDAAFKAIDRDESGTIELEEFKALIRQLLQSLLDALTS